MIGLNILNEMEKKEKSVKRLETIFLLLANNLTFLPDDNKLRIDVAYLHSSMMVHKELTEDDKIRIEVLSAQLETVEKVDIFF